MDTIEALEWLKNKEKEEFGWKVFTFFENNHLSRLFWMDPQEINLWLRFHDVILCDSTYGANIYKLRLCLLVAIDNNNMSRIVAQAVLSDETADAYKWLFQCLLHATDNVPPVTLFTDSDPAVINACHEIFPTTNLVNCIFHINMNITKKLKGKLGNSFNNFFNDFLKMRNSLCEQIFNIRLNKLLTDYPQIIPYFQRTLIPNINC
jgi:hypothetical protein